MKTLLVVDDDEDVRIIVSRRLAGRYQVMTAPDACAALEAISYSRPDLVLLDLTMPGLSGSALLRALRRAAPDVPVVVVTGGQDLDAVARTLAGGASGCLLKPFSGEELDRFVDGHFAAA